MGVDSDSTRRQEIAGIPAVFRPAEPAERVACQSAAAVHEGGQPRYFIVLLGLGRTQAFDLGNFINRERHPPLPKVVDPADPVHDFVKLFQVNLAALPAAIQGEAFVAIRV